MYVQDLASDFCDKKMTAEEFLNQYLPSRIDGHKKRVKSDKLGELLRDGQHNSWSGPSGHNHAAPYPSHGAPSYGSGHGHAPPYPSGAPSHSAPYPSGGQGHGHAPYPTGGMAMPMPSLYR